MDITANTGDNDYLNTMSVLEEVRPAGAVGRVGRWLAELEEEFRSQRGEGYEPLFDFPRDL